MSNPKHDPSSPERKTELLHSFLTHPGESSLVDYKEGVLLASGIPFAKKLVKHIIGMCNSGGGYIVIGYKENEHKVPEPATMDSAIAASYDPSSLASMVEKYTAGSDKISIQVHKIPHPSSRIVYPIIEIEGFDKRPFFCKSSVAEILEDGALYIRTTSARTIKAADPDEWERLINKCVEKRGDELLARFSALAREMGLTPDTGKIDEQKASEENRTWLNENHKAVEVVCQSTNNPMEGIRFYHWPVTGNRAWHLTQLRDAAQQAILPNTGWPMGMIRHVQLLSGGLRAQIIGRNKGFDYWNFQKDGGYYFFRTYDETDNLPAVPEEREIDFDVRIWRIAEAVDHTIALYKALGLEPTARIKLVIEHLGLKDRKLVGSRRHLYERTCHAENVHWNQEISLDNLKANRKAFILEISKALFELFEFFVPSDDVIYQVLDNYEK